MIQTFCTPCSKHLQLQMTLLMKHSNWSQQMYTSLMNNVNNRNTINYLNCKHFPDKIFYIALGNNNILKIM